MFQVVSIKKKDKDERSGGLLGLWAEDLVKEKE
jgi:hypothetical protein